MQNISALQVHGVAGTLVLPWRHVKVVICLQSQDRRSFPTGTSRAAPWGPLWRNTGLSGKTWPGAQVPEAGNARCLLMFSVQVVLMVRVACVFIIVDEGQLVCREGTWGRV